MLIFEAIQYGIETLQEFGIESPEADVEWLLAYVLQMHRTNLRVETQNHIPPAQLKRYLELVRKRTKREPLQHILGNTIFCGLEFVVSRDVFIPRPETEILAEKAWTWLHSRDIEKPAVLDFGTGSGCLSVTLAVRCPKVEIVAVDISSTALVIARQNATTHKTTDRVDFRQGDGFATLREDERFTLIVSNPPYIATDDIATLEPEIRNFEPQSALDGGEDGLDFYHRLAAESRHYLAIDGRLMTEVGDGQADAVRDFFLEHNWVVENVEPDYSGLPRVLTASFHRNGI